MRMVGRAENGNDPGDVRRRLSYVANGRSVSIGSGRVARQVSINAAKVRTAAAYCSLVIGTVPTPFIRTSGRASLTMESGR